MRRRLLLTPQAEADLVDIATYIAEDNPVAADKLIDRLAAKSRLLIDRPEIGHVHRHVSGERLLCLNVERYLIFYRVVPEGIEVVRYLHGRRDLDRIL